MRKNVRMIFKREGEVHEDFSKIQLTFLLAWENLRFSAHPSDDVFPIPCELDREFFFFFKKKRKKTPIFHFHVITVLSKWERVG